MSVDGETLSAITGMEEACATARARVEDLVAELDDLRRCIRSVITQRDEALAEVQDYREQLRKLPDANRLEERALTAEERLEQRTRERDEARAQLAELAAALDVTP